ncbi:SNF2 family N-terminal domain-containing protein [Tricladium varicosporioides]|nr:SNF2 family N-terminal domain-containing protein [Hymenoscyphus varicosporioides]
MALPHTNFETSSSQIQTPLYPLTSEPAIDLEDSPDPLAKASQEIRDDDDDIIQYENPTARRRSLRERKPNRSLKALENGEVSQKRSRRKDGRNPIADLIGVDPTLTPVVSQRVAIRQEIANKTTTTRNRFFVEKKDLLLPLLPPNNHVKKLVEEHDQLTPAELAQLPPITPYQEIETQPKGVKATMKPYQLSGLSFMVYLHRNGLSGILGDEMGLGKTLQTLSLIQYLKENDPKAGTGRLQRPFLIVCPLSVLSSWMGEAKKWTPGLKAIRFHGPVAERTKMKKIVMGEIDSFGNMTSQAKSKYRSRRKAAGRDVVSLDSDSDGEARSKDVGVDLVVTTYDCFKAEQSWFKKAFVWRYVVLDEGHTVKNHDSLISKSLQGIKSEYRLILTGTPLQNNLSELWSLLHWLYPEVFTTNTNELFDNSFNLTKGHYSNTVLDSSRHLLELIMLRRMKNSPGVELGLPPKTEVLLFVPLSPMQRFWYQRMITKADQGLLDELFKGLKDKEANAINTAKLEEDQDAKLLSMEEDALKVLKDDSLIGTHAWEETKAILEETVQREQAVQAEGNKRSAWQKLMNLLMQLRKVCNHPYQLAHAEPDPYHLGEHIIHASGKFIVLDKLVTELVLTQKKKILIFSGFTQMLNLVQDLLDLRGGDGTNFRSVRIDGATARARRNLGIRMFNDVDSDCRVMLISTRAGGLGINLATASDIVLLDQDWNPQITLQAEARAHRIGQKNPVTIYKLVSQGTVEEQMMGRIQKKLYLSAKVTEAMQDIHTKFGTGKKSKRGRPGDVDESMPQLNTNQLMTLVRRGASAISRPEVDINEMLNWDWETTVLKCKDQPADFNVKKDAIPDAKIDEEAERKWLTEMERVESSVFDGKKLAKSARYNSNKDIAEEYDRAQRRIGKNVTVMVDGFAISKESMNCGEWESVPTLAGKDPRLADQKRQKKAMVENQSHCQICVDGGELTLCQHCPRSYHMDCLDRDFQAKARKWQFICPQHECFDCEGKTTDAGGMLYRCRWCERAFCEDCLDFDKAKLIGETIPEYELLDYPAVNQAFYISCHICENHFAKNPKDKKHCDDLETNIRIEYEQKFSDAVETSSRTDSMTDATTIESNGVNTPMVIDEDDEIIIVSSRKRKRNTTLLGGRSQKRKRGADEVFM